MEFYKEEYFGETRTLEDALTVVSSTISSRQQPSGQQSESHGLKQQHNDRLNSDGPGVEPVNANRSADNITEKRMSDQRVLANGHQTPLLSPSTSPDHQISTRNKPTGKVSPFIYKDPEKMASTLYLINGKSLEDSAEVSLYETDKRRHNKYKDILPPIKTDNRTTTRHHKHQTRHHDKHQTHRHPRESKDTSDILRLPSLETFKEYGISKSVDIAPPIDFLHLPDIQRSYDSGFETRSNGSDSNKNETINNHVSNIPKLPETISGSNSFLVSGIQVKSNGRKHISKRTNQARSPDSVGKKKKKKSKSKHSKCYDSNKEFKFKLDSSEDYNIGSPNIVRKELINSNDDVDYGI